MLNFPAGSVGEESTGGARNLGSVSGSGGSSEEGKFHEQTSLAGSSPWGHKNQTQL